jgi:hypothetical protein
MYMYRHQMTQLGLNWGRALSQNSSVVREKLHRLAMAGNSPHCLACHIISDQRRERSARNDETEALDFGNRRAGRFRAKKPDTVSLAE